MASSLRQARLHFKRMSFFLNNGIRIGGWPLLCHLSVLAPIGIAESLRSIQRNLTYAILVLKKHIGQQFLFPICPLVLGGKMAHQIKRKQKVVVQKPPVSHWTK
jgi:hypothetical protein